MGGFVPRDVLWIRFIDSTLRKACPVANLSQNAQHGTLCRYLAGKDYLRSSFLCPYGKYRSPRDIWLGEDLPRMTLLIFETDKGGNISSGTRTHT